MQGGENRSGMHNPEAAGSSPAPATSEKHTQLGCVFLFPTPPVRLSNSAGRAFSPELQSRAGICREYERVKRLIFIMLMLAGVAAIPARQAPPAPIRYGESKTGELNDIQRAVQFVFDATAGDNITVSLQTTSGDVLGTVAVTSFDGEPIATGTRNGADVALQTALDETGAYVITVGRESGSGAFSVNLALGQPPIPETIEPAKRLQPIVRGTPAQVTITPDEAFSLLWFEGQADEAITISASTGSFQPLLVLYDAAFNELGRSAGGTPLSATLPTQNLYFISVALPVNADGGSLAITLNSGNTPITPPREVQPGQSSISYGESVRGTISNTATAYTFQFSGTADDEITVSMTRAGGDLDSFLYLLDSGGVTVAQDDNSGGNGDARLNATLPATGDYLILATRTGQEAGATAGNFLLTLSSDSALPAAPQPTQSTSTSIPAGLENFPSLALGETVTGQISHASFLMPYLFYGTAGDEIMIRMTSDDGLDSMVVLLNGNQETLAENDDIPNAPISLKDSELAYTLEETGYYIIVATRFDGDAGLTEGSYQLSVSREGQSAAPVDDSIAESFIRRLNAERIRPGATPVGAFDPLRFARAYAFGVSSEALIDFTVSTDNNLAATIILTDGNLQPISTTDGGTLLGVEVPAGNYLLLVAPAGGPAQSIEENYILAFNATGEGIETTTEIAPDSTAETETAQQAAPIAISYGDTRHGEINNTTPNQDYIFSGVGQDTVRISMTALPDSELDSYLQLLDIEGDMLAENDDIDPGIIRNSLLQFTLPADGEYIIRATRYGGTTAPPDTEGEYELVLEFIDPTLVGVNQTILPITDGQTITNAVSESQYLMFYSFTANSGDLATIRVNTLSGDLDAVLYLYAYTSSGEPIEIARNDDSPLGGTFNPLIDRFSIPRAGTYLIAVGRFPEGTSAGEFSMTLTLEPPSSDTP